MQLCQNLRGGNQLGINVLITSAGRRVSLIKAFKKAIEKRNGTLYAGDMDELAPSLYFADKKVKLYEVLHENYIFQLLEIAEREKINLIVPTIDTELMILSKNANLFKGINCKVLVSGEKLVQIANDKWETVVFFNNYNIKTPRSWIRDTLNEDELPDILFVKPRGGSASKHTYKVNKKNLSKVIDLVPEPIIQEYLNYPEITIDCLLDMEGRIIHYVPRMRLKAIGGESVEGITIPDDDIRSWILRVLNIISSIGGIGPITIQAFLTDHGPILSEINPRFGGGVPLTFAAGGDYPEWILQMLEGNEVAPRIGCYKKHLCMTRFYQELFIDKSTLGETVNEKRSGI